MGEHAIGLQIKGLAGKVAREKLDKMQVQALNMQQQPVALDVVCTLFVKRPGSSGKDCGMVLSGRYTVEGNAAGDLVCG